MNLDLLLESAGIWRGGAVSSAPANGVPTGFPALDELLPCGGLPRGALTEVLTSGEGIGALSLIMPALARLSRSDKWLAWIAPPHIPYAPVLASLGVDVSRILLVHDRQGRDNLWALEQALRSGACGAVIAWLGEVQGGACGGCSWRPKRVIPWGFCSARSGLRAEHPRRHSGWPWSPQHRVPGYDC